MVSDNQLEAIRSHNLTIGGILTNTTRSDSATTTTFVSNLGRDMCTKRHDELGSSNSGGSADFNLIGLFSVGGGGSAENIRKLHTLYQEGHTEEAMSLATAAIHGCRTGAAAIGTEIARSLVDAYTAGLSLILGASGASTGSTVGDGAATCNVDGSAARTGAGARTPGHIATMVPPTAVHSHDHRHECSAAGDGDVRGQSYADSFRYFHVLTPLTADPDPGEGDVRYRFDISGFQRLPDPLLSDSLDLTFTGCTRTDAELYRTSTDQNRNTRGAPTQYYHSQTGYLVLKFGPVPRNGCAFTVTYQGTGANDKVHDGLGPIGTTTTAPYSIQCSADDRTL